MHQWAAALVEHVRQRLRQFYEEEGRPVWFAVFAEAYSVGSHAERFSQQELGERFRMTRDQVRYALEMVQKRFVHYLRDEIRDQVGSEAEVGDEVCELLALLER